MIRRNSRQEFEQEFLRWHAKLTQKEMEALRRITNLDKHKIKHHDLKGEQYVVSFNHEIYRYHLQDAFRSPTR